jgi:hypothetical protein
MYTFHCTQSLKILEHGETDNNLESSCASQGLLAVNSCDTHPFVPVLPGELSEIRGRASVTKFFN